MYVFARGSSWEKYRSLYIIFCHYSYFVLFLEEIYVKLLHIYSVGAVLVRKWVRLLHIWSVGVLLGTKLVQVIVYIGVRGLSWEKTRSSYSICRRYGPFLGEKQLRVQLY